MKAIFKYNFFLIALTLMQFISASIKAQLFTVEFKAGVNTSAINNYSYKWGSLISFDTLTVHSEGYYAGVLPSVRLGNNWYFAAGIEYYFARNFKDNFQYDYEYVVPGAGGSKNWIIHRDVNVSTTFYTYAIPIMIKFTPSKKFTLESGVLLTFNTKETTGVLIESSNGNIYGYGAGTYSYDINKNVAYGDGDPTAINTHGIDAKISAGYFFYKNLGVETSFQIELKKIYEEEHTNSYGSTPWVGYYSGGHFNVFSLGLVYRLQ